MPKTTTEKLTDLVTAVGRLPEESQAALVDEFAERLSDFTDLSLSEKQRDEVGRRLANPRYADANRMCDFFTRYGVQGE
jgi:hypothetical protein